MEDNIVLTIVVPSYNTSEFIEKNISTMMDDRLKNIVEVLIVDDGSEDDTLERANRLQKRYPEQITVVSKGNAGHGSVINKGIECAKGKYFRVIDGDDWVLTEGLVTFVGKLKSESADLVLSQFHTVDKLRNNKKVLQYVRGLDVGQVYDVEDVAGKTFKKLNLHELTIKTKLLRENDIHLTEKCFYDDMEYALYPIVYAKTIVYYDISVYQYLIGQINQSVSDTSALKHVQPALKIIEDSYGFYQSIENQVSDSIREYVLDNICNFVKNMFNVFLRNMKEKCIYCKFVDYKDRVKRYSAELYDNVVERYIYIKYLTIGRGVFFYLFGLGLLIYKKVNRRV